MTEELYKRHRPARFADIVGQESAVRTLVGFGKAGRVPHCLLLYGPKGCGKTSAARILKAKLGCADVDYKESNSAEDRGIDAVRAIMDRMMSLPMGGKCRMWILDEFHQFTRQSQEALLKPLEDTPPHVYFVLVTTDPDKLIAPLRSRATEVKFGAVRPEAMRTLLDRVAAAEGIAASDELLDRVVAVADGSARKALVLLDQALCLGTDEERLAAVAAGEASSATIDLARALVKGERWPAVARVLKGLDDEPETVRRACLGYFAAVLLGGGSERAWRLITIFERAWYDGGRASMAACCWEAVAKPAK